MCNASTPPSSVPEQPKGLLDWLDPCESDDPEQLRAQLRAKIGKISDVNVRTLTSIMDALHAQEMATLLIAWYDDPEDAGEELTPDALMRYVKGRWTIPL